MSIYLILFIIVFIISLVYGNNSANKKSFNFALIIVLLFATIIAGIRDIGVGTDTEVYIRDYYDSVNNISLVEVLNGSANEKENLHDPGFSLLSWMAHLVPGQYNALLFLSSLFFFLFMVMGIKKMSNVYNINLFFIILPLMLYFYNQSYNYMRQFCALGLLFWGFGCFLQKAYFKYFISQFFAYFFHSSSVFFFIVPLLYLISNSDSSKVRYTTFGFIVFVSIIIDFYYFDILLFMVSHGVVNDLYGVRYGEAGNYDGDTIQKTNIILFVAGYVVILYSKFKNLISENIFIFCLLLHTLYVSLYLLTSISVFLFRISFYVYIIEIWYLALILSKKRTGLVIKSFYVICLIIYWFKYFIIMNACETYPYKSSIIGI